MNKVFLSGNLTRDVEVRYTQSGKAFARMGIAINRRYKDKEQTDFFNLVAWEKIAEFCGKYLAKGSRVLVEGQLRTNSYENRDGVKVNTVEIWIDNIEFAGAKRDNSSGENSYGGRSDYSNNSRNDYSSNTRGDYSSGWSANRDSASSRKISYEDGFGGEPIDPEDTPF